MIVFDDMIDDMLSDKNFSLLVTEMIIRDRELNISVVFIAQSCFAEPKNNGLNCRHYFIIKIPNKREL